MLVTADAACGRFARGLRLALALPLACAAADCGRAPGKPRAVESKHAAPAWKAAIAPPLPPEFSVATPGIEVHGDRRVDLMGLVMHLTSWGESHYRREGVPYLDSLAARPGGLAALKAHRAVVMAEERVPRGLTYDAPYGFVMSLGPLPGLVPIGPVPEAVAERAGLGAGREEFAAALAEFATAIDFEGLWAAGAATRAEGERAVGAIASDLSKALREYYGPMRHMVLIPAPLLAPHNHATEQATHSGARVLYAMVSPMPGGVGWRPGPIRRLAAHEFGHSVVNPLGERHGREVDALAAALWEPIRDDMSKMAYPRWRIAWNEHVVRAVVARLEARARGPEAGARIVSEEFGNGFVYIAPLYEALAEYEADRSRWPTFADFYPRLLEAATAGKKDPPAAPFRGPINAAFGVPFKGRDRTFMPKERGPLADYVRDMGGRFGFDARIAVGTAASLDVVAPLRFYGTPAFAPVATLLGLAGIAVEPGAIVVRGERVEGTNLRVIFAVPHPKDPMLPVAVYAAQREEDLVGIHAVFHGPTDVVVAHGTKRLLERDWSDYDD